jgi:tryptophanyl-tRNA synthetase
MAIVFSGIQATGNLTIGNYLGALQNWVKMQADFDCIFCIVDLHSITLPQDPAALREASLNNLALYLASGIDPNKSILFAQSAVPAHSELAWIFSCSTPMGWLNRMTQFKDKAGKHRDQASLGLYAYPVLMAADILLYGATHVPVGEDQTQHIELTRDIAGAFNRQYKVEYFQEPIAINSKSALRIMSLRDGKKKMSKSDESDYSRINLTDSSDLIVQKIKKAKSDAITTIFYDEERRPEISNLLNIYCAFAGCEMAQAGAHFNNHSTAAFKDELAQTIIAHLAPVQNEFMRLLKDKGMLMKIAQEGAAKANALAEKRMAEIKKIVGLWG